MAKVAERAPSQKPQKAVAFRYEGLAEGNRRVKGIIRATSEMTAHHQLMERGFSSVSLQPAPSPFSLEGAFPSLFSIKPSQVAGLCTQLATLLEAGVSLLPALQLLAQQRSHNPPLRRILGHITSDLSTGNSLSQALSKHPQVFNEIALRSIEVGERTGKLEVVLRNLAEHIEKQEAFGKKIKGAMTYPMIILVVALVVSFVLLTVVLPPLTKLFSTFGTALPLPTRILMGLSGFFSAFKLHLIGGVVILVVTWVVYMRRPGGRRLKDQLTLKMPLLGSTAHMSELARLARTMSLMLGAGLSLQDTIDVLPRTTTNILFREALLRVRRGLFLGQGLTRPMAADPMFPPLMLQMVRVGEDSNTLDVTMRVVANFYEAAADQRSQALVALITPLSTILLSALVAFIALSVIMPMYSITGAIE